MKKCYLLLLAFLPLIPLNAQTQAQPLHEIAYATAERWYTVFPEVSINVESFINHYAFNLGLGPNDKLELASVKYDETGLSHHYFDLYHQGYQVEHATLALHQRNGRIEHFNFFLPQLVPTHLNLQLNEQQAIQSGLSDIQAEQYLWEVPFFEELIKEIKHNNEASFYPEASLMMVDTDFEWETNEYRLAYKMEVFTAIPHGSQCLYIDAENGRLLKKYNTMHHEDVEGTAVTRYSGTQTITTDSTGTEYRLRDYSRAAGGIETYDMNNGTDLNAAVDFTDADNFWDNANADYDEVATDVHWGTQRMYDFLWQRFGRDSYDGMGTKIPSFVHFDSKSYTNAFWNVYYAGYGDGGGMPQTPVDIVGHEIGHGIIRNSLGNLIYIDESASLNEGYADIFGNTLQQFADSANFSWLVGEQAGAIRSMSDPSSFGNFSGPYPDTYKGNGWYNGNEDNGGAHLNSTVFSHWFYLVAAGGSGTNDNGNTYQVSGVGVDAAIAIAYRMLDNYLLPTAQFEDAWQAAIQSAEDLYGTCSAEAIAVTNAWFAVGFGFPVLANDMGIIAVESLGPCGLGETEAIQVRLKHFGCDTIPAGTTIQLVAFVQDPFASIVEPYTLTQDLTGGEVILHTFQQTVDLSGVQNNQIFARSLYNSDPQQSNDNSPTLSVINRYPVSEQFFDFEASTISLEDSLIFASGDDAKASIESGAGNGGSVGILMEGNVGFRYRFVEAFPLWGGPKPDVFDYNPTYSSWVCLCVDATELQTLNLRFDRRQEFSTHYKSAFSNQFPNPSDSLISAMVNNLRVTADGNELARYNGMSPDADPWTTHSLNLDAYAGSHFQLCFEGKTVFNQLNDPQGRGDRIYLDNIELEGIFTSVDPDRETFSLKVWPNPVRDILHVQLASEQADNLQFRMVDRLGKKVWVQDFLAPAGTQEWEIKLPNLARGMYLLEVVGENRRITQKIVISD